MNTRPLSQRCNCDSPSLEEERGGSERGDEFLLLCLRETISGDQFIKLLVNATFHVFILRECCQYYIVSAKNGSHSVNLRFIQWTYVFL